MVIDIEDNDFYSFNRPETTKSSLFDHLKIIYFKKKRSDGIRTR